MRPPDHDLENVDRQAEEPHPRLRAVDQEQQLPNILALRREWSEQQLPNILALRWVPSDGAAAAEHLSAALGVVRAELKNSGKTNSVLMFRAS